MPIKCHNFSVWHHRNPGKLLLHQVVVIVKLPALHALKIRRISIHLGYADPFEDELPSEDFDSAEPLEEEPFSGDFGSCRPFWWWFRSWSNKKWTLWRWRRNRLRSCWSLRRRCRFTLWSCSRKRIWPWNCDLRCLCRRTRWNCWPGRGWRRLCNTLRSWDQTSGFRSWLR